MSPFFNTMGQNNTMSPKLPRRGQLGGSLPNTMGQYHGGYLGFALYECFFPYATWHFVFHVHTRLLLDRSAYSLRHTLFIINLAHTEFLSSFPSVLTVDTSDQEHILSSTTSSSKLSSSSSSGLSFKDNTLSSGLFIKGNTFSIILSTTSYHIRFTSLPSPSGQE